MPWVSGSLPFGIDMQRETGIVAALGIFALATLGCVAVFPHMPDGSLLPFWSWPLAWKSRSFPRDTRGRSCSELHWHLG